MRLTRTLHVEVDEREGVCRVHDKRKYLIFTPRTLGIFLTDVMYARGCLPADQPDPLEAPERD